MSRPCKRGHTSPRSKTGHCLECRRITHKAWRAANPEKEREYKRRSVRRRRKKINEYQQNRREEQRLDAANRPRPETCELCGRPPNGRNNTLHFDHDHETGEFRGWLCSSCNVGLGMLGDTLDSLKKAVEYLDR